LFRLISLNSWPATTAAAATTATATTTATGKGHQ